MKVNMQAHGDIKSDMYLMSALQQMVLFVFKCTELIVEAWVGMVLF